PQDLREVHAVIARYAGDTNSPGFGTPMPPLRKQDIQAQQTTDPFSKTEAAAGAGTTMRTRRRKAPVLAGVAAAALVAAVAIAWPLWPRKSEMTTRAAVVNAPKPATPAPPPAPAPTPPETHPAETPVVAATPDEPAKKSAKPPKKKKSAAAKPATLPGGVPEQVP